MNKVGYSSRSTSVQKSKTPYDSRCLVSMLKIWQEKGVRLTDKRKGLEWQKRNRSDQNKIKYGGEERGEKERHRTAWAQSECYTCEHTTVSSRKWLKSGTEVEKEIIVQMKGKILAPRLMLLRWREAAVHSVTRWMRVVPSNLKLEKKERKSVEVYFDVLFTKTSTWFQE